MSRYWPQLVLVLGKNNDLLPKVCGALFEKAGSTEDFHQIVSTLDNIPSHLKLALTLSAQEISEHQSIDDEDARRVLVLCKQVEAAQANEKETKAKMESEAPNLCALVGTKLALQIVSNISMQNLAKLPSSNLANKVPQLEDSDLVRSFSPNEKQALRQICSKLVLCARIDLQNPQSDALGRKWRKEIDQRLSQFRKAPEIQPIRPLAVPMEHKSKRRGGQRVRRMKERMAMSQVERLQNRMAFNEMETVKIAGDEEVGMGLLDKQKAQLVRKVAPVAPKTVAQQSSIDNEEESDLLQFL